LFSREAYNQAQRLCASGRRKLAMKVEYINPFVTSTTHVFSTMLNCDLVRGEISLKKQASPEHQVSGIIGLSGRAHGVVVLSLNREAAISAAAALLGERPSEVNAEVKDAVGELVNIIAGGAKAQLAELEMSVTIPTVITGKFCIDFPSGTPAIVIPFSSMWGPLTIEVGLKESPPRT
jgi:chemotaxis protein CheX